MPKLTFYELAIKVLSEVKQPLSPSEIWKFSVSKGYDQQLSTKGKTPAQTLYSVIFLDERDNPKTPFEKVGSQPYRYALKSFPKSEKTGDSEKAATIAATPTIFSSVKEKDLHPFLCYFVYQRFNAYSKTIKHGTSNKKEFGEWVHPDMIATYYPVDDWAKGVLELGKVTGNVGVKLYSFEIKRQLSFSNLRESFFQTVSNSSWAHEGYLVAGEVSTDQDFRGELRRLSTSFGIGIVELDLEDPDSSEVLVPARERESLDWEALNKLSMNKDVTDLLVRIKNDLATNEVRKEYFDVVQSRDYLVASIKKAGGDS